MSMKIRPSEDLARIASRASVSLFLSQTSAQTIGRNDIHGDALEHLQIGGLSSFGRGGRGERAR